MSIGQGPISEAQGFGAAAARSTIALDGTANNGAVGTVTLFRVTGNVIALVVAACTKDLVSVGGGTVEVGVAGSTNAFIVQTAAGEIDTGEIWVDDSPTTIECWTTGFGCMIGGGLDIIMTVASADVTDGTLIFTCFWTPLDADARVDSV